MSNYILKTVGENFSKIRYQRREVGKVYATAGKWQGHVTYKGRKVEVKDSPSKMSAFEALVTKANRIAIGVEPDDVAGAAAKMAERNAEIAAEVAAANKAAGFRIARVRNNRVLI